MARPVGARDKNKKFLLAKLKDMYGDQFDPIMRAAALADNLHKQIEDSEKVIESIEDPTEKLKMASARTSLMCDAIDKWCKIAEFTNGKISAITLSQDPENPLFEMSRDEREREINRLLQAIRSGASPASPVVADSGRPH